MKGKAIIIIIITLILGFVIGMLTSAQLRHKRMRSVRIYSERYYTGHMYKIIEPSEEQREVLDEIINQFAEKNRELQIEFRKEFGEIMDELWNETKPFLTKEQIEKLEEQELNRMKRMKEFRSDTIRNGRRGNFEDNEYKGRRRRHPLNERDSLRLRMSESDSCEQSNSQDQKTDNL